jgi:hypothetical protein
MALSESLAKVDLRTDLCTVGKAYDSLSDEDKKAFDNAVAGGIGINTLKVALQAEGFVLSWNSLNSHTKKLCRCAK